LVILVFNLNLRKIYNQKVVFLYIFEKYLSVYIFQDVVWFCLGDEFCSLVLFRWWIL